MLEAINQMHKEGKLSTIESMSLILALEFSQKCLKGDLGIALEETAKQEISGRVFQQTVLTAKIPS